MDNSLNAPIAAGDVIVLKSGGPTMTVEGIEKHPADAAGRGFPTEHQLRAVWFDTHAARQEALFWPHMVVLDAKAAEAKKAERDAAEARAKQLSDDADRKRQTDERATAERQKAAQKTETVDA